MANWSIKTSPNYVSTFLELSSVIITMFAIISHLLRSGALFISDIHLLTQYSAPGLLSLSLAMPPSKLCPIAPSQSQNYRNGPCTGPLLALLLPLSMSQSGSLAGILCFLITLRYQPISDSFQKGAVLLGSKDFVLVIFILATDTG